MKDMIATIVLTIVGSNALIGFVQFLITRHDTRKNIEGQFNGLKDDLKSKLKKQEKDSLRTQLLLLTLLKPDEVQEIMTISRHYFVDLEGNWYMTSIFNKWLQETETAEPEWFNDNY